MAARYTRPMLPALIWFAPAIITTYAAAGSRRRYQRLMGGLWMDSAGKIHVCTHMEAGHPEHPASPRLGLDGPMMHTDVMADTRVASRKGLGDDNCISMCGTPGQRANDASAQAPRHHL